MTHPNVHTPTSSPRLLSKDPEGISHTYLEQMEEENKTLKFMLLEHNIDIPKDMNDRPPDQIKHDNNLRKLLCLPNKMENQQKILES